MTRLILLAIGAWTTYRVIEENGFLERRATMLLPPPAKSRLRAQAREQSQFTERP